MWTYNFSLNRIKVKCNIEETRISGKVIVVKLATEHKKAEVMKNKNRLVEGNVYIENNLNREERERQREIWDWIKERKMRGENVKIGLKRVRVKGIWRSWEKIEKEEVRGREETSESE